jgi:hypothetical protein
MKLRTLATSLLVLSLASAASADPYSSFEKFSKTYPLVATGTVQLSNINGSVDIVAWDKPEVLVEAEKRAPSDEDLQRLQIKVEATADHLVIKTEHERMSGWFSKNARGEVRYQLKVPAGVRLEKIGVVNSNITVTGVRGAVNLSTVNGRIRASGLGADAQLDTVNGSITAEFDTFKAGQILKAKSVNGGCEFTLPKDAAAQVDTSTVNGSTRCAFPITLEKSSRRSLRGTIGGGGATLKVSTVNGSIAIKSK